MTATLWRQEIGTVADAPGALLLNTTDTFGTITAAGYMNTVAAASGINVRPTDFVYATYNTAATAANEIFTVSISAGVITLMAASSAVITPTILNHIATYANTSGTISEDPATAISGGNIQAGLSGTAGTLASFPGTATKGSLIVKAVANTGNTNTTISNAAMGQATVVSMPDPGVVATNFILSDSAGTQTIATGSLALTAGSVTATAGNLQAGSSGHAGTVSSFPATGSKGHLALVGVANSGDTITTISNDAMGQASVMNIPDPANAIGQFMVGATATPFVSGNLPKASGTAGLMIDSGVTAASISGAVTQLGALYQVSVTFNTAQMVTAYDTPLTIVANPSASQMILVLQASVYTASTGHTQYATGTAPIIQYSSGGTNGQHGAGTIATAAGLVVGDITAAASQVRNLFGFATGAQTGLSGLGLYFSNATGNFTAGTGTNITITVVYQLLTATV